MKNRNLTLPSFCIILLLTVVIAACKKDNKNQNPEPEPNNNPGTALPCDTFSQHNNQYQFYPRIHKVSIHKSNPDIIAYAIKKDIGIEIHTLDLSTNTDIQVAYLIDVFNIDFNKYGDLLISGYTGYNKVLLGKYNDPVSFRNVYTDSTIQYCLATWLADGNSFAYTVNENNQNIHLFNRDGSEIKQTKHTDTAMFILGSLPTGGYITLSKSFSGKRLISTCDTNFKNCNPVQVIASSLVPLDIEHIEGTNRLVYTSIPDSYLTEIDLNNGNVLSNPLHCQNLMVDDIDYCPANGRYIVCLRMPVWENGKLTAIKQIVCTTNLTNNNIQLVPIP
jgi:hypothetical protein